MLSERNPYFLNHAYIRLSAFKKIITKNRRQKVCVLFLSFGYRLGRRYFIIHIYLTREFLKTLFLTFCIEIYYNTVVHLYIYTFVYGLAKILFMRIFFFHYVETNNSICARRSLVSRCLLDLDMAKSSIGSVDIRTYTRIIIIYIILLSQFASGVRVPFQQCVLFAKPFSRAPVLARKPEQMCHPDTCTCLEDTSPKGWKQHLI